MNPPNTIYLQWNPEDEEWGNPDPGDVTWCAERVFDSDIEYIRLTPEVKGAILFHALHFDGIVQTAQ